MANEIKFDSTNTAIRYLNALTIDELIGMTENMLILVLDHLIVTGDFWFVIPGEIKESYDQRYHRASMTAENVFRQTQVQNGNMATLKALNPVELAPMNTMVRNTLLFYYK